jgi:2-oxoglutarate ferredoxin oxidoreductase subunit alpha
MHTQNNMSIRIGGDAGQGIESSGATLSLALARAGLHVFSTQDYRSRIRGGHNFYQVRISSHSIHSHSDPPQLLLALTGDTVDLESRLLAKGASVIYDESEPVSVDELRALGLKPMGLPLGLLAEEHGSRVLISTAAVAAACGVIGLERVTLETVLADNFHPKGERVVQDNLAVARASYDVARRRYAADFAWSVRIESAPERMLLNGNQAIALGALAAGCRFIAAYPMTPGTTVFEFLASIAKDYGLVAKHAEDEIAAICMAIGAGFAGARAMTTTSGGGFSLMVEALGLAGMTEVPIVVVDAQRGGPSTGLPTRTEQPDLLFAIHASQGEFPRVVLAPGSIRECFTLTAKAFNLADKYQLPAIILTDTFLAGSLQTVDRDALDFGAIGIDRGKLLSEFDIEHLSEGYRRFELTSDGVSPRAIPGQKEVEFSASSDEHDEHGHITEDIEVRHSMMEKRMRKERSMMSDLEAPRVLGPRDADLTLICWGSSCGPVREASNKLNALGQRTNVLHITQMWPFPSAIVDRFLRRAGRTIVIEQNYTGQFSKLLRMTTSFVPDQKILKYDGRPYTPEEIVQVIRANPRGPAEIAIHTEEPVHSLEVGSNV